MLHAVLRNHITARTGASLPFSLDFIADSRGDVATNLALLLAKQDGKNPLDVATTLAPQLVDGTLVTAATPVAPGFINLTIADTALTSALKDSLTPPPVTPQTIIVEYGSENIAKPLSVGHLIGNVLGQSLTNLLRHLGHTVITENHLGDYGTQFGKVITAYKLWGDKNAIHENPIEELVALYVRFHTEAEKDQSLEDRARAESKLLEDRDPENYSLWQWFREESIANLEKVHARLGVTFDHLHGEAFFEDALKDLLTDLQNRGIAITGEGNSLIIPCDESIAPIPLLVRRGDGGTVYATRDLATVRFYVQHFSPDAVLQVVGSEQSQYFSQMYDAAQKAGYMGDTHFTHIRHGLVRLPEGKMSTRKGRVVALEGVLDEAISRVQTLLTEKGSAVTGVERDALTETLALGAVKFSILRTAREKNIVFRWDDILSFDGFAAPYIQYAYARTQSLLVKATPKDFTGDLVFTDPLERTLALLLASAPATLLMAASTYHPHHLAQYAYQLAQTYSTLYQKLRIVDAEEASRPLRLLLTHQTATTLRLFLSLLGITVPEKM